MRRFAAISVTAIVLAAACGKSKNDSGGPVPASGAAEPVEQKPEPLQVDTALIARGAYVANVAGCTTCHVGVGPHGPDPTRSLSGGFEAPDTFGTWRPGNITSDKATGVGAWTDAQLAAAIREGTLPDGTQMYPIMPFPFFNRMTDDDLHALIAFLRTLPAVSNKVAPNDLKLMRMSVPKPANQPDPKDDAVKHGEYLATLMHCASCHTPMGPRGPDLTRPFAGGMAFNLPMLGDGTLYAANITSDPDTGIGKWSEQQIIDALTKLTKPDGSHVQGPMMFYLAGWTALTPEDLSALAKYVKTIPAVKHEVPASTFTPKMPGAGKPG
jgi:mono/diheme cytochrome c family protein